MKKKIKSMSNTLFDVTGQSSI